MCVRFSQIKSAVEIAEWANASIEHLPLFNPEREYNAYGHPKTPIITHEHPGLIKQYHWGLIPEGSPNQDIRKFTVNAKIETLDSVKSFKNVTQQRCLILATEFFEWQWQDKEGKKKQKYKIWPKEENVFAFGGLWSEWSTSEGKRGTYTIVTMDANELMAEIHNHKKRMPLILKTKNEKESWLKGVPHAEFKSIDQELEAEKVEPPSKKKNTQQTSLFD